MFNIFPLCLQSLGNDKAQLNQTVWRYKNKHTSFSLQIGWLYVKMIHNTECLCVFILSWTLDVHDLFHFIVSLWWMNAFMENLYVYQSQIWSVSYSICNEYINKSIYVCTDVPKVINWWQNQFKII
jgi:hypothetical protein